MKFLFLVLFFLGGLASSAKSEAMLSADLLGLVVAGACLPGGLARASGRVGALAGE